MTGQVVWLTGLSGAGKSTIARALEQAVRVRGHGVYVLDGDAMRTGLCAGLGFSASDRSENVRRVGEVARILAEAGLVAICALISPTAADRARVRARLPPGRFLEIYINAPLAVCEQRDPKGLYARASRGDLQQLTGVSAPYEAPVAPDLELRTDRCSPAACVAAILDRL